MQDFFVYCILTSLKITAVYYAMLPGNILSPVREFFACGIDKIFGDKWTRIIQKPLWDCLPCMASVYTIIFTWSFNWSTLEMILIVSGINALFEQLLISHD